MFQLWMSVLRRWTRRAAIGKHEVVGQRLVVGEEEVLDHLGLVAEAEHEVGEAEVRVVLHHVPEDRPVADLDHRLGDDVGGLAHPEPLPTAEDDDFHTCYPTFDRIGRGSTATRPACRPELSLLSHNDGRVSVLTPEVSPIFPPALTPAGGPGSR